MRTHGLPNFCTSHYSLLLGERGRSCGLEKSSPTFLTLWTSGRGERGMILHKQPASVHAQLHLRERHACVPTAHANGAHKHAFAHCLHKWGSTWMRSPAVSVARFQTVHDLLVGHGPELGDLWCRELQVVLNSIT